MRVCPKPLNEQTARELLDCGYQQSLAFFGRILQSYLNVFIAPGEAELIDWTLFLATFFTLVILVAKGLAQKQR